MKKIILALLIISTFAGCSKDEECKYDECGVKAPATEVQNLQAYLQSNNIVATEHCSGIYYTIQQQGTGTRPTACSAVSVYYKGTLTNGTVFDQTQVGNPAAFNLGGLITGFKNGLLQIKTGGKVTIYIPPSLGYGSSAVSSIPANSILIFEVELLATQ
jgi:FKBP-type peptidyl-prolyl cis-trans isomerase FkpA